MQKVARALCHCARKAGAGLDPFSALKGASGVDDGAGEWDSHAGGDGWEPVLRIGGWGRALVVVRLPCSRRPEVGESAEVKVPVGAALLPGDVDRTRAT